MKAYLLTTGTLFSVSTVVHVVVVAERWRVFASDPWPAVVLAVSAGLSPWAWRLIRPPSCR